MNQANFDKLFDDQKSEDDIVLETLLAEGDDVTDIDKMRKNQTPIPPEKLLKIQEYVDYLSKKGLTKRNIKRKVKRKFNITIIE